MTLMRCGRCFAADLTCRRSKAVIDEPVTVKCHADSEVTNVSGRCDGLSLGKSAFVVMQGRLSSVGLMPAVPVKRSGADHV